MPITHDEFDARFAEYRHHLREEVLRFRGYVAVYRQIQARKVDHLTALNLACAFFQVVESSLFTSIVLWADKLFDERGERGFFNFLKFVELNRMWLCVAELQQRRNYPDGHWMLANRKEITFETIEADRERIRALDGLKSFRLRRDKFHGHFDKQYFFDRSKIAVEAPIRWSDLDDAGTVMGQFIDDYSTDFDGTFYAWDALNIDDLKILLNHADRSVSKKAG